MYSTFIFDLDGTLLDTLQDLAQSVNHALRTFGMAERPRGEIQQMVGNGVRLLVERAVPPGTKDGVTKQVFEAFCKHYLEHSADSTHPYEGIMETLHELKRRGARTAIVSNKLQAGVTELHERFFRDSIDVAIGEQTGIRRKPSPDMVDAALRNLNAGKDGAVYIGDSDVDILTARNSGLPCISVLWGFRSRDFLLNHGADTLISDPKELLTL